MKDKIISVFRKKVSLSDVVSPDPSKAARRAIDYSLMQAYKNQKIISEKVQRKKIFN